MSSTDFEPEALAVMPPGMAPPKASEATKEEDPKLVMTASEDNESGGNLEADEQMLGTSEDEDEEEDEVEEEDEEIDDDEDDLNDEAVNAMLDSNLGKKENVSHLPEAATVGVEDAAAAASAAAGPKDVEVSKEPSSSQASCSSSASAPGEEPSVRNLIMAAIGVMKNRKARPDTKRICNWIHRRYGQPYGSVSDELERLVTSNELAKVEYKGSVSFRIINNTGKATKRRRRGAKPLGRAPNAKQQQGPSTPTSGTAMPVNSLNIPAALTPASTTAAITTTSTTSSTLAPPLNPVSDSNNSPVSLRTLVCDLHGENPTARGLTITIKYIEKAVEASHRNISKQAVLSNLELILEKEVQAGHFISIGRGCYTVPPLQQGAHTAPVALPQGPQPSSALQPDLSGLHPTPPMGSIMPKTEPIELQPQPQPGLLGRSFSMPVPQQQQQQQEGKTEDERKNDLIQEKLFKMKDNAKGKSPGKKLQQQQDKAPSKEPFYLTLREKRNAEINRKRAQQEASKAGGAWNKSNGAGEVTAFPRKVGRPPSNKKVRKRLIKEAKMKTLQQETSSSSLGATTRGVGGRKRKREAWSVGDMKTESEDLSGSPGGGQVMRGSVRKKKSRKIFDPADHDTPSGRKRKISSSPTPPNLEHDSEMPLVDQSHSGLPPALSPSGPPLESPKLEPGLPLLADPTKCRFCLKGEQPPIRKNGSKKQMLLHCKDCNGAEHPKCLDYTEDLTRKILTSGPWQCIACKTCSVCQNGSDDAEMLFCDSCDLGYHMKCHKPSLGSKPPGRWECCQCNPIQPLQAAGPTTALAARTKSRSQSNDYYSENSYSMTSSRRSSANTNSAPAPLSNGFGVHPPPVPETSRFAPLLPPHLHPSTGALPENWEAYPPDPSIPDCRLWEPRDVMNHFLQQGFPANQIAVFLNEEIDGKSLLLLHRSDVLGNLGLKMGPALKVFNHVKKLQTRRHFPS